MTPDTLASIELDRYREVARRVLGAEPDLMLVQHHELIRACGPQAAVAPALLEELAALDPSWHEHPGTEPIASSAHRFLVSPLTDHSQEPVAHLIWCTGPAGGPVDESAMQSLLGCLQRELDLASEVTVMTDELTARYEELNLVYETQDQASDYEESHAQLRRLIENTRGHLNVAFCALLFRDKKLTLYDISDELSGSDVQAAFAQIKGDMYDWVLASRETAVINDVTDQLAEVLCPNLPYRVVVAPILSGGHQAVGALVTARTFAQPRFSNGDKNLLDVMARKASKIVQASYDTLTGLMKRSGFDYELRRALHAHHAADLASTVLIVDIDRLQIINDTLSQEAGDRTIKAVADTIRGNLRTTDSLSRLGSDEFGVLLSDCTTDNACEIAAKICRSVAGIKLEWNGHRIEAQVSIGVASIDLDTSDPSVAIASAEVACSSVKDRGGDGVSVFNAGDRDMTRRRSHMDLVGRIQDALRTDRFELYCQPITSLQHDDETSHGEVLLRMCGEEGEMIPPGLFLPAAERYHLMPAIDRWVVARAIAMLGEASAGGSYGLISINLSGQTLSDGSFSEFIQSLLAGSSVPPSRLCFEITETTAISDLDQAKRFIQAIREHGVLFSLDDFGTGLSGFTYLKELPVHYLKIDGSFVKEICRDPVAATMVSAINDVAHTMGLKTVGEFVEDDDIRRRLKDIGIDYGQGYGIAKPMPFVEYLADLAAGTRMRNAS